MIQIFVGRLSCNSNSNGNRKKERKRVKKSPLEKKFNL